MLRACAKPPLPLPCRHLTESKIYTDTKAKDVGWVDQIGEAAPAPGSGSTIVPLPSSLVAAVTPSLNIRSSLATLWEFKYVLVGTASTWFLMDGASDDGRGDKGRGGGELRTGPVHRLNRPPLYPPPCLPLLLQ